jgi:hypothetical protein
VCPKGISVNFIARMNREMLLAMAAGRDSVAPRTKP